MAAPQSAPLVKQLTSLFAAQASWISAHDPRLRLSAAAVFALVTVNLTHFVTLSAAAIIAAGLLVSSASRTQWRNLLALESILLILLITLPLTVPNGLALAVTIWLKANAVGVMVLALVGSLEPMQFGHALARLGVPSQLVQLLVLTIRQIYLLDQEFIRLRQAMRARAFVPRSNRHTWRSYGWLVGMLLVRSLSRSQRLLAAMRLRGFHGRLYVLDSGQWQRHDTALALGLMLLFSGLLATDWWLR
ncbi:energy-coupling factor transporter transmembrane component T [Chromatium okenii]|uniref:energy-coupling factor transporter transmembrane component T family protein n=1 Tax=Chromatium okenii TaxID=61644 RepID=UPI003084671B